MGPMGPMQPQPPPVNSVADLTPDGNVIDSMIIQAPEAFQFDTIDDVLHDSPPVKWSS